MRFEDIICILLLIDAVSANVIAWAGDRWYVRHARLVSRYFPAAKGWTAYYLILVLWIGWLLLRIQRS